MEIADIKNTLKEKLGITYLLPHQELIINHIASSELSGKRAKVLACLPTGSGKSICFMAPAVFISGLIICVYPLLSLMADQEKRMKAMGIEAAVMKGGMDRKLRQSTLEEIKSGRIKAVVTNMEMLLYLSGQEENRELWKNVGALVIDEVHIAATWGDTFRPSYKELPKVINTIKPRHILAFTATMDKATCSTIIERVFLGEKPYIVKASSDRTNIFYHSIRSLNKDKDLLELVKKKELRPCVVFCPSRNETERVSKLLLEHGIKSIFYHAGLNKEERKRIEDEFYSSSDLVLAATSAYGVGVDKKNIRATIHIQLPEEAEEFLQEAGRAGRDGREAHSFVLWNNNDRSPLISIYKDKGCIRKGLLALMDEESDEEGCIGCSNCQNEVIRAKGEEEILTLSSRHIMWPKKLLIKRLSQRSFLSIRYALPSWSYRDIIKALDTLKEEGILKEWWKFIYLTRKGNKRLLLLRSRK